MADMEPGSTPTPEKDSAAGLARSANEVALEMMKFIAVTTGYGKTSHTGTGFSAKPQGHSAEEQAVALMELFERCRQVVKKDS